MADYTNPLDQQNQRSLGIGATLDSANKLAEFLRQKQQFEAQQEQPFKLAQQKAQLGQQEQQRNLDIAKQFIEENTKQGRNMGIKVGDVDIKQQEENPLKYLLHSQQSGNKALQHAYDMYAHGQPKIQERLGAISEGLDAANDPQQINSIGAAKTLLIKSLGMNRYNQQEGNQLVPPQLGSTIHQIYNALGGEMNPLTASQRDAVVKTLRNGLQATKASHQNLKGMALGSYKTSGYYDPNSASNLQSMMGQEVDKSIDELDKKYSQPVNQMPTGSGVPQQPPSMIDRLKGMFGGSQSAPTPSSQPPMSFDEFKKRKAAGQL